MARTTISLDTRTRDRLKSIGRKGETYDELLNRLIDRHLEARQGIDFERVG